MRGVYKNLMGVRSGKLTVIGGPMYLRDLRKRAANLADDMAGASKLLQHSSEKLTADHYRTKPVKLLAVR